MKFNFLKIKRNKLPAIKSLRPQIFNTDLYWFVSLGLCAAIIIVTILTGFRLFYSQYFESYKNSQTANYENLIDVSGLKSAVEKRITFINAISSLPRDPSL